MLLLQQDTVANSPFSDDVKALSEEENSDFLGSGTYSTVYKMKMNDRTIAMKHAVGGVEHEQKILSSLHNRSVVTVYESPFSNRLYMEYLPFTVDGFIDDQIRKKKDSMVVTRQVIFQLATVLEYLKSMRVIHFDIKKDNIMFRENGDLVLIDFGMAMQLPATVDFVYDQHEWPDDLPPGGAYCCQPKEVLQMVDKHYIQRMILNSKNTDLLESMHVKLSKYVGTDKLYKLYIDGFKADVYSTGVFLFKCVTQEWPNGFTQSTGAEAESLIGKIERRVFRTVPEFKDLPSEPLKDLLANMLEPCQEERISAAQILSHKFMRA